MTQYAFSNFAASTLASNIGTGATTIALSAGTGALFPAAGGGITFDCVIYNTAAIREVVRCTSRSTDLLTVTRAQEGTTALAWTAGDGIAHRLTAAWLGFVEDKLQQIVNIKDKGAATGSSDVVNKTALQTAITDVDADGGGVIIVDYDVCYGLSNTDSTTWPSFTSPTVVTSPIIIYDRSRGLTYSTYPATYDGAQTRVWDFTPQPLTTLDFTASLSGGAVSATLVSSWAKATGPWSVTFSNGDIRPVTLTNGATTATWASGLGSPATSVADYQDNGQHDGNTHWHRGNWPPAYIISNDKDISGQRYATDNLRAYYATAYKGSTTWQTGQGTLSSNSYTAQEMLNWQLQKYFIDGVDSLGSYSPVLVERSTGKMSVHGGRNNPKAAMHVEDVTSAPETILGVPGVVATPTIYIQMLEAKGAETNLVLRNAASTALSPMNASSNDVGLRNAAGVGGLTTPVGDALNWNYITRRVKTNAAFQQNKVNLSYSTSITPTGDDANIFQIFASNGVAFAINAPSGTASDGQKITVRISNTSGGALGAITWNATYKMAAWVSPATGFGRSITFYYDASTPAWIEISRNAADIPN